MISSTNVNCPYCGKCKIAFDFVKQSIVVNPDSANNQFCDHLCFADFSSHPPNFNDGWTSRLIPDPKEVFEFFAEFCFSGMWNDEIRTEFKVIEQDSNYRLGKRIENYALTDEPPDDSDMCLISIVLFAKDPKEFAREFLLKISTI